MAAEPGEVLAVPRDALRRLIATDASLSDKVLAAFLVSRYLLDRIEADKRIVVRGHTRIVALEGDEFLTRVRISSPDGEETLSSTALFSFIGAEPASQWLSGFAALDDRGFVLTDRAIGREHLDGPPLRIDQTSRGRGR